LTEEKSEKKEKKEKKAGLLTLNFYKGLSIRNDLSFLQESRS